MKKIIILQSRKLTSRKITARRCSLAAVKKIHWIAMAIAACIGSIACTCLSWTVGAVVLAVLSLICLWIDEDEDI